MTTTTTLTKDQIAAIKWERKNKIQNVINYALATVFMIPVVTFGYFQAQAQLELRGINTTQIENVRNF
jgi:hypothetical protein